MTMQTGKVSVERIGRQIEALRVQEEDAKAALRSPVLKPGARTQLRRLLGRIDADRKRLSLALQKANNVGTDHLEWREVGLADGDPS
jgi:hypothetical protein